MTIFDRFLQRWRITKVSPFIPAGARVLDIGYGDGALFRQLHGLIREGIGIDATLLDTVKTAEYFLLPGRFPTDMPNTEPFDVITLLAVLEHVPTNEHASFTRAACSFLKTGGVILITVPSPRVEQILKVLTFLHLIHGMSLEQHYGFDPKQIPVIFSVPGLRLIKSATFQCGLNNIFVFKKVDGFS